MEIFNYGYGANKTLPYPISMKLDLEVVYNGKINFKSNFYRNDRNYQYGKISTDDAVNFFKKSNKCISFKMADTTYLCAARFIVRDDYTPVFINLEGTIYCNHELINRSEKMLQKKLNAIPVSNIHELFYARIELPIFRNISDKKKWLDEMSELYNKTYNE